MSPRRVLHVLGQRPEMTGSGFYQNEIIRQSLKRGIRCDRVAGVPAADTAVPADIPGVESAYARFDSRELPFAVPGMSDVMPYQSSLFRDLDGRRLEAYLRVFERVLREAATRLRPEIVHTNHLFVLSALVRKTFPDLPVVATCHGTDLRQFANCRHLRPFVRRHCGELDRIIALTADQRDEICRLYGIPAGRVAVAGGGYDQRRFTRAAKAPAGTVHFLYAGKINRSKGVPWLLRSFAKLRNRDWHLHLAGGGKGPEYDRCIALIKGLAPRVTHHGYVDQDRLAGLMKMAHVQILPSFFEGLPLALFEGLASGCRIIATRLSGYDEIFGRARADTVRLIDLPPLETIDRPYRTDEAGLEEALADALQSMAETVRQAPDFDDPEADRIASRFTWPRVFERVLAAYRTAAADHRVSRETR